MLHVAYVLSSSAYEKSFLPENWGISNDFFFFFWVGGGKGSLSKRKLVLCQEWFLEIWGGSFSISRDSNHKVIFRHIGGLRLVAIGVSHMAISILSTTNTPIQVEGTHTVKLEETLAKGIVSDIYCQTKCQDQISKPKIWLDTDGSPKSWDFQRFTWWKSSMVAYMIQSDWDLFHFHSSLR